MNRNERLFQAATSVIPGGVNSPVRAFKQVGGTPVFIKSASKGYLKGEDGKTYIDFINSWGPMILGHRHPVVAKALKAQLSTGYSYGAPTELETKIAKLIRSMVPGIDMIRMVNSGTEACMSAVRLARGFTNRSKILKFEGHYHGHADMFLKKAGSGMATLDIKVAGGVPSQVVSDTIVASFNDFAGVKSLFDEYGKDIAAVIVEPVAGNMGCVPPLPGFLEMLRLECDRTGTLLIFDEVMTGFRLAPGGAQELYEVKADIVTFGKIIGGGLPVGAFAARKEIMQRIAPLGDVYQAGTLSGNPLAMAAGFATLQYLHEHPEVYRKIADKTSNLANGFKALSKEFEVPLVVNQVGSMISIHFMDEPLNDFTDATRGNNETFKKFFHHMLKGGIYLPPSAFESWFISLPLSNSDIDKTLTTARRFFRTL